MKDVFDTMGLRLENGVRAQAYNVVTEVDQWWPNAVRIDGPKTRVDERVIVASSDYPVIGTGEVRKTLVLVSYPRFRRKDVVPGAYSWATGNALKVATPRQVFSLAKQYGNLNKTLGGWSTYVIATEKRESDSAVCYVCWGNGSTRWIDIGKIEDFFDGTSCFDGPTALERSSFWLTFST